MNKKNDITACAKIYVNLDCADRLSLFKKMISELEYANYSSNEVLDGLIARDEDGGCSVGNGIYLPHVRLPKLTELGIAIATLRTPLKLPTIDNQPLKIVCLLLIPAEQPMEALKFMAELVGCLRNPELYAALVNAHNVAATANFMLELSQREALTLTAADLMVACVTFAVPSMPLIDVTRMMLDMHCTTVPVIENGILCGEINCAELFKLGIPDFFNRLPSVGFIRYFDPFENYFSVEAASFTRDVMNTNVPTFTPESTLIEIVFAISVQKVPLIYVTDPARKLLGIITPELILSRIINF